MMSLQLLGVHSVEDENEYFKEWYALHRSATRKLYRKRSSLVHKFSWAVPSAAALQEIQDFCNGRKIIEIGAGTGYWASLLQAKGQAVVPIDNGSEPVDCQYTEVIQADGREFLAAHDTREDVLMCCWPRSMDDWLAAFGGQALICIGELEGATDYIQEEDTAWRLSKEFRIPQYLGMRDMLRMYSKVSPQPR